LHVQSFDADLQPFSHQEELSFDMKL